MISSLGVNSNHLERTYVDKEVKTVLKEVAYLASVRNKINKQITILCHYLNSNVNVLFIGTECYIFPDKSYSA